MTAESFIFYAIGESHVLGYIEDLGQFLLFDSENYIILENDPNIDNL